MPELRLRTLSSTLPRIGLSFPEGMGAEQRLRIKGAIVKELERTKNHTPFYEAPPGFAELATYIHQVYGSQSDLWRLFTKKLCPVAVPSTLWEQYEDKDLTFEEFCALMPQMENTAFMETWLLNETLTNALRFTVWEATRKGISRARKGKIAKKIEVKGLKIHIDRPCGFIQKGIGADGAPWTRVYQCDYGFIPGTIGGDGEELDVFVGGATEFTHAYLIYQKKHDGSFDEWKLMLQFASEGDAKSCYTTHIPPQFMGECYAIPIEAVESLINKTPEDMKKSVSSKKSTKSLLDLHWRLKNIEGTSNEAEQYILGVVLVPEERDTQGEIYDKNVIRRAAHEYLVYYRNIGDQHRKIMVKGGTTPDQGAPASLVESFVAPVDMVIGGQNIPEGTWMVGMKFHDPDYWAKIDRGEITGLSMGGMVSVVEEKD